MYKIGNWVAVEFDAYFKDTKFLPASARASIAALIAVDATPPFDDKICKIV